MTSDPTDLNTGNAYGVRHDAIEYLKTHRNWYASSNFRFGLLWNVLSLGSIVLSTLTAILAAMKGRNEALDWWVIALPATAALLSTLLMQFRIMDMWQLRDEGRIAAERLLHRAYLIPVDTLEVAKEEAAQLRQEAFDLEIEQSRRFFSFMGGRRQPSGGGEPPGTPTRP